VLLYKVIINYNCIHLFVMESKVRGAGPCTDAILASRKACKHICWEESLLPYYAKWRFLLNLNILSLTNINLNRS
jgi:hypothetical protein